MPEIHTKAADQFVDQIKQYINYDPNKTEDKLKLEQIQTANRILDKIFFGKLNFQQKLSFFRLGALSVLKAAKMANEGQAFMSPLSEGVSAQKMNTITWDECVNAMDEFVQEGGELTRDEQVFWNEMVAQQQAHANQARF